MEFEQLGEMGRRLDAIGRLLGQQAIDRLGQPLGNCGVQFAQRTLFGVHDLLENGQRRIAGKRGLAGAHLVQDRAQTEQVGSLIGLFAQRLLGGHVERRAGDESGGRELHILGDASQAKIGQLHAALRRFQQDVARLDVAMDQSLLVGRRETLCGLHADAHDLAQGQLFLSRQPLLERFAGDELHDQVGQGLIARLLDLMHRDHIFVRDRRGRPGLAAEALPGDRVAGQLGIENLERHVALQPRVEGFEHQAHAAAAQDAHHVEMGQPPEIGRVGGRLEKMQRDFLRSRHDLRLQGVLHIRIQAIQGRPVGRRGHGLGLVEVLDHMRKIRSAGGNFLELGLAGPAGVHVMRALVLALARQRAA